MHGDISLTKPAYCSYFKSKFLKKLIQIVDNYPKSKLLMQTQPDVVIVTVIFRYQIHLSF